MPPTLLWIVGPPAVGTMTVAEAIADRTGLRVFHNHLPEAAAKPTKRDLPASRQNLLDLDERYRMNTTGEFDDRADYLRIENTDLAPAEVADRVIEHYGL